MPKNLRPPPENTNPSPPVTVRSAVLVVLFLVALSGLFLAWLAYSSPSSSGGTTGLAPTHTAVRIPPGASPSDPSADLTPDTGWVTLHPGLERRLINLFDPSGVRREYLYILRLDPRQYSLDVAYNPRPRSLAAWQAQTGALAVVNGGYYRVENGAYLPDGLIVADGKAYGQSYGDYAGMLAVSSRRVELRWLQQRPYDAGEPLLAALQSFPLLVKPGGVLGFPAQAEDHQHARRTVIAQDKAGRILLILAPRGSFTLYQIGRYLTDSDLGLNIAMNLDGGPSTGLLLADPYEEIPDSPALPIVILVR